MANIHVEVSGSATRLAGQVRNLVDETRSVSNDSSKILAICNAYLGPAPNLAADLSYADLATALGFTGANANLDAHNFYALLVAAQGRLTGAQISAFVDQLG